MTKSIIIVIIFECIDPKIFSVDLKLKLYTLVLVGCTTADVILYKDNLQPETVY